ncbi:MFS transporter, partial [Conexibacter sp. CPCC 205706]
RRSARAGGAAAAARPAGAAGLRAGELFAGWRLILADAGLRPLFLNALLVNGLIMATEPSLAVLMLGQLGFEPWQYGLAFAVPCVGGLIGSRLARRVVARHGQRTVMRVAGTVRACWLVGLAFVGPGVGGLLLVMAVELGLIVSISLFNPVMATYRLQRTPPDRAARVLSAWSISASLTIAALTALWGVLASLTSPRAAIAIGGLLMLATPLLLPRERHPDVAPPGAGAGVAAAGA